jgi:hypothetical protein
MKKSSLDLAAEGLYREISQLGQDIYKLSEVTRPIAALYGFQGMVDNGGFRYPLEADWPGNPPYSLFVDAYRRIGAKDAADAFERAVSLFPFKHPEWNADARNEFMPRLGDDHEFNDLSDRVCGDKTIWKRMDEYIAKHHKDFAPYITQ